VILRQGIERFYTVRENRRLKERVVRYAGYLESQHRDPLDLGNLSAESPTMREAVARIESLAAGSSPVLVTGEPGTEKELFASALHIGSPRERGPFVVVSSPAFSGEALERELFGWEKGAFDEALVDRAGRLELAHEGTLVLAELDGLGHELEDRIDRFLADSLVRRVGSQVDVRVDVRWVATTTAPAAWLEQSRLRAAFAERVVVVPPLRERRFDLPAMCQRLLLRSASRLGRPARAFTADAMALLVGHRWPGNFAELAAVVERAALLAEGDTVTPAALMIAAPQDESSHESTGAAKDRMDLPGQLDDLERRELCIALERCGGNKAEVARMLGIQRTTLYYRLKRLGIEA
jgi:DNA-binding NtrC family response regulator